MILSSHASLQSTTIDCARMAALLDLPPELILHTVSFLLRKIILDPDNYLPGYRVREPELVPDLPSVNALAQTNTVFQGCLNQSLYDLCASVPTLGKLALLFAIQHQLENTVDRLVAAGVSLDSEFIFEYNRCSILHIAAGTGLRAMVVKLLEMYGMEMRAKVHTRLGLTPKATALDYAARHEHMDILKLLAPIPMPESSVRYDAEPETHKQYLSLALIQSTRAGKRETSEYLVLEGADVNFLDNRITVRTPLYYAAATDNLGLVQFLLASGADPNLGNNDDFIPLFNAARNNNMDIVQALLGAGANINVKNRNSRNVLAYCADVGLLRFLLERGVDPNLEDYSGETPLHHACAEEDAEFAMASVELLLQFGGATVEKASHAGRTPVDIAIAEGYTDIVELLEPLIQNPDLKLKIAAWWEET